MKKTAIVLFNMGGPDDQDSVVPFLSNLFNDPCIISVPQPFRYLISKLIIKKRIKEVKDNYYKMGGGSPIVKETRAQAAALQQELKSQNSKENHKVFFFMRYWHPFAEEIIPEINDFAPDKIILLPLYPQFSTTTTGSTFTAWKKAWNKLGEGKPNIEYICCYPIQNGFIEAYKELVLQEIKKIKDKNFRILFSAHGLPVKVIKGGDPYQSQVQKTVHEIVNRLQIPELDYTLCYQSKVGPMKWLEPSTEDEIKRAAGDGKSIMVVPVAFVSEHIETLVELDDEYYNLAKDLGISSYHRVQTVRVEKEFIKGLAEICSKGMDGKICSSEFSKCGYS